MAQIDVTRAALHASCQISDAALLLLDSPSIARIAEPGQFVMVRIPDHPDMPAPRPLSIADADEKNGTISLLVKMRGKGTAILRNLKEPTQLLLWGPCGRPFSLPEKGRVLLVAGGVGIAPLLFLAKRLRESGIRTDAIFGAKTEEQLYLRKTLKERTDTLLLCTDDGTIGRRATAVEMMRTYIQNRHFEQIYICGPEAMLNAAIPILKKLGQPAQALIENRMLCGVGICACCTTHLLGRTIRLCVEGPVCEI